MRNNISKTIINILVIVSCLYIILFVIFSYTTLFSSHESFANKNKRTMLDVDGNILGFDMIDHQDTFDFESEMIDNNMLDVQPY